MEREEERQTHESFGQIQISRVHSGGTIPFYGSELPQNSWVEITVHESEINRDLTRDRYHSGLGSGLINLRMTAAQFSEMITSLNMGGGTCCTIQSVNGIKKQPLPVQESRKEFMHRKFEDRMKMFANTIRQKQQEAKQIVKKKTLSKDDVRQLSFLLDWLTQEIEKIFHTLQPVSKKLWMT